MSEAQERARNLLAAITQGPLWVVGQEDIVVSDGPNENILFAETGIPANAAFIAAAPELLITLCAELDAANNAQAAEDAAMDHEMSGLRARLQAAEAEIERLRTLLSEVPNDQ